MRYSKQRDVILQTLKAKREHPTAEQLYTMVKAVLPDISLATVYRNLNQLAECGEILKLEGLNNMAYYDGCVEKHHHFICTKCNKVYDINHSEAFDFLRKEVSTNGFQVDDFDLVFKGICPECLRKTKIN